MIPSSLDISSPLIWTQPEARPIDAGDEAPRHWVAAAAEDDRNCRSRGLCRERSDRVAMAATRRRTRSAANSGSRSISLSAQPIFDRQIAALDITDVERALRLPRLWRTRM